MCVWLRGTLVASHRSSVLDVNNPLQSLTVRSVLALETLRLELDNNLKWLYSTRDVCLAEEPWY